MAVWLQWYIFLTTIMLAIWLIMSVIALLTYPNEDEVRTIRNSFFMVAFWPLVIVYGILLLLKVIVLGRL